MTRLPMLIQPPCLSSKSLHEVVLPRQWRVFQAGQKDCQWSPQVESRKMQSCGSWGNSQRGECLCPFASESIVPERSDAHPLLFDLGLNAKQSLSTQSACPRCGDLKLGQRRRSLLTRRLLRTKANWFAFLKGVAVSTNGRVCETGLVGSISIAFKIFSLRLA
jgi:hypothetical protein